MNAKKVKALRKELDYKPKQTREYDELALSHLSSKQKKLTRMNSTGSPRYKYQQAKKELK